MNNGRLKMKLDIKKKINYDNTIDTNNTMGNNIHI